MRNVFKHGIIFVPLFFDLWYILFYYHDGNGGYYGAKTANQPINYIWNPTDNTMVLHNSTPNEETLTASVDIFDIKGKLIYNNTQTKTLPSDTSEIVTTLSFPAGASRLKFIRTTVKNSDGEVVGRDFYWHNTMGYGEYPNYQDYSSMADMDKATVSAEYIHTGDDSDGEQYPYKHYKILLKNTGDTPAIMIRLKVMKRGDGERVLPVYYEDNYFSLMPGETREVWAEFKQSSIGDDSPVFMIEGWNVDEREFAENGDMYVSGVTIERNSAKSDAVITDGSYTGSVDIISAADTDNADIRVMLALYRNGIPEKVIVTDAPKQISAGKTTVTTEELVLDDGDYDDCEIRGFVWTNGMKPHSNAAVLSNSQMLPKIYADRNIAPEAVSVTASSEDGTSNPIGNVNDGNDSTRWATGGNSGDDAWILFDFGSERMISSFIIKWEAAYGKQYRIEISSDGENFTEVARMDSGTGGTDEFAFEPISARYVRWVGEKRGTGWGYSMYEFEIHNNTDANLALNAPVSVSSNQYGEESQKITDGDLSSRWTSLYDTSDMTDSEKDDQWVIIDLGSEQTFRNIQMVWEAAYGKEYTISVSSDGQSYTEVYSETNGKEGLNKYTLDTAATGRYVKFKLNKRGTGWGYSLYEILIYN